MTVNQCGKRYHVFNNRRKDLSQVEELLRKINTLIEENGGSHYTNEMLREAKGIIREVMGHIQKENPDMSPEEARQQAQTVTLSLLCYIIHYSF